MWSVAKPTWLPSSSCEAVSVEMKAQKSGGWEGRSKNLTQLLFLALLPITFCLLYLFWIDLPKYVGCETLSKMFYNNFNATSRLSSAEIIGQLDSLRLRESAVRHPRHSLWKRVLLRAEVPGVPRFGSKSRRNNFQLLPRDCEEEILQRTGLRIKKRKAKQTSCVFFSLQKRTKRRIIPTSNIFGLT